MLDIQARQKWLRDASKRLAAVWKKFERDPIAENDKSYAAWVICADGFSSQFLTRAKLYDEPLVKSAMSDDELKTAVTECMKKMHQDAQNSMRDGNELTVGMLFSDYFEMCYGSELEFILNATKKKEAAENV